MMPERWRISSDASKAFEWPKWIKEIPFIKFPASWEVKVIPPKACAVVRFLVRKNNSEIISIYLDCYEELGYFGEPHWEIYPDKDGNNSRFAMNDIGGLLKAIAASLRKLKNHTKPHGDI